MTPLDPASDNESAKQRPPLPLKRRFAFIAIIYFAFLLFLISIEAATRLMSPHLSSLDLFVVTTQQKAQVADAAHAGIFEGDPLLLWRLKPNLDRVVWDFTVVSTNSAHLRSEQPGPATREEKQPGTIRIICLGDSVTFGYRVPVVWPNKPAEYDAQALPYPMLLEKQLRSANPRRNIEVITMAVPGYTSHQGLAWLRRDIAKLSPDLLIVSFGWNDASLSDVPDREAIKTNFSAVTVRWLIDHSQAFAHATHWLRKREQTKSQNEASANATPPKRPVPRVSQQEHLDNMTAIEQLARDKGARVIAVAAPYRDHSREAPEANFIRQYRLTLGSLMRQRQTPFLEILELTEEAYPSNEGWFGERIHPNHMGHRLMASELLKLIDSNQLLKDVNIPTLTP
jgi:lysophospholipase L1-like esterase